MKSKNDLKTHLAYLYSLDGKYLGIFKAHFEGLERVNTMLLSRVRDTDKWAIASIFTPKEEIVRFDLAKPGPHGEIFFQESSKTAPIDLAKEEPCQCKP